MAKTIELWGAEYPDVPAVDLPLLGGGAARFTDVTPTDAVEADVARGKVFFLTDGTQAVGTSEGGGSYPDGDALAYGTNTTNRAGAAVADSAVVTDPVSDMTGYALADLAALVA